MKQERPFNWKGDVTNLYNPLNMRRTNFCKLEIFKMNRKEGSILHCLLISTDV